MNTKRFLLCLFGTSCYFFMLSSCSQSINNVTLPDSTTTCCSPQIETAILPVSTKAINDQEISLLSNFDPDRDIDFTIKGLINIENHQAFFDFDTGEITNLDSADIYLDVGCGTQCFNELILINGARSIEFGKDEPGFEVCNDNLQQNETKFMSASIVPGTYSCIYTNEGNIVQMLAIKNEAFTQNSEFVFEYEIWVQNK